MAADFGGNFPFLPFLSSPAWMLRDRGKEGEKTQAPGFATFPNPPSSFSFFQSSVFLASSFFRWLRGRFFATKVLLAFAPFSLSISLHQLRFPWLQPISQTSLEEEGENSSFSSRNEETPERERERGRESRYLRIKGAKARVVKDFGGA